MIFRNDRQRRAVFSKLNGFYDRSKFVGVMPKKDHLAEIPDYYDRLEEMEDGAKEDGAFIDVEALKKSGEFAERPKAVTFVAPTPLGPMLVKEDLLEEFRNKPLPNVPRNEELIRKLKEAGV